MAEYASRGFDITTDPRTTKIETAGDVFYVLDVPSILGAVDRGARIALDDYSESVGIVEQATLDLELQTNSRSRPVHFYRGVISCDELYLNNTVQAPDLVTDLGQFLMGTDLAVDRFHWSNVYLVTPLSNQYGFQVDTTAEAYKIRVSNSATTTNGNNKNYTLETRLGPSPISQIDSLTQLHDAYRIWGATLQAARNKSTYDKQSQQPYPHFITQDGMLRWSDGHYQIEPAASRRDKKSLGKPAAKELEPPDISAEEPEQTEPERLENYIRINDIGGLEVAKASMQRLITSFKNPDAMKKWGARRPNGVLFYGPPGTGKTTLARAVANEVGADLWEIKSSEIFEKWLGSSEANLKSIFDTARRLERPTVMFWDEFEAIIPNTTGTDNGVRRTENAVVGIYKQEVEGLYANPNIIFIACTNNISQIDETLMRAGRVDEKIYFPKPNEQSRQQIWAVKLGPLINWGEEDFSRVAADVDFDVLARQSDGWTGADITAAVEGLLFAKAMAEAEGNQPGPISQSDLINAINSFRTTGANEVE